MPRKIGGVADSAINEMSKKLNLIDWVIVLSLLSLPVLFSLLFGVKITVIIILAISLFCISYITAFSTLIKTLLRFMNSDKAGKLYLCSYVHGLFLLFLLFISSSIVCGLVSELALN